MAQMNESPQTKTPLSEIHTIINKYVFKAQLLPASTLTLCCPLFLHPWTPPPPQQTHRATRHHRWTSCRKARGATRENLQRESQTMTRGDLCSRLQPNLGNGARRLAAGDEGKVRATGWDKNENWVLGLSVGNVSTVIL